VILGVTQEHCRETSQRGKPSTGLFMSLWSAFLHPLMLVKLSVSAD
jgi:hypothetical protein